MVRFALGIFLAMHGLAHLSGLLASWTTGRAGFLEQPWLFPGEVTVQTPLGRALSPLWLVAVVGLVAAGVALMTRQPWWPTVAVAAAVFSLVVIVLWWRAAPAGAKVGAVADLLILAALAFPWKERLLEWARLP